ncbi:MAG TPA: CYCXC family (seleno)protein [Candidatus Solibacter sp.]|nr:CYCXC family (seleno)protein [Candidatus Solibacter sp.]
MRKTRIVLGGMFLVLVALALAMIPQRASSRTVTISGQDANADAIPAYHTSVPEGPLPATMNPSTFTEPVVQNAYRLASRIRKVLYQQPCYCHCDRSQGHGSLLDCYVSKHAAECGVCLQEDFYAYEQVHKGKSAVQIREGIESGDWKKVDLNKYQSRSIAK